MIPSRGPPPVRRRAPPAPPRHRIQQAAGPRQKRRRASPAPRHGHGRPAVSPLDIQIFRVIGRQTVLDTVARAASARVGSPVRVTVKVGKPESAPAAPAPAHDNLDDLLAFSQQFDNITIK